MNSELNQLLEEEAKLLEAKRKKLRILQFFYVILVHFPSKIILIATIVFALLSTLIPFFIPHTLIGIVAFILLIIIPVPYQKYSAYIKDKVLPKIFKAINPTFNYEPEGLNMESIKASWIFASALFSKAKRIEGEDLVTGLINDVKVSFNEVKFYSYPINWGKTIGRILLIILLLPLIIYLTLREGGGSDGDGVGSDDGGSSLVVRDEIKFYKGLFLHADFHKEFKGKVVVFPKELTSNRDKFSQFTQSKNMDPIRLENAILDEKYTVFTSNEQLAYYVLSPSFIQSLFEIYSNEKALPIVSFIDGQMYMTIPWEKDYFSVSLKTKVTGSEYFTKYINEINSFQKIVEHMSLDRRIWTKV